MRRTMMILVVGAFLVVLFVPGAVAATGCVSIFSGTAGPDTLEGDRCDNISGLGGG